VNEAALAVIRDLGAARRLQRPLVRSKYPPGAPGRLPPVLPTSGVARVRAA